MDPELVQLVRFCETASSWTNTNQRVVNENYSYCCVGRKHPEFDLGHECPGCRGSNVHAKWAVPKRVPTFTRQIPKEHGALDKAGRRSRGCA